MQSIKSEFEGLGKRNYANLTDAADHSDEEEKNEEDLEEEPVEKQVAMQSNSELNKAGGQKRSNNGLISARAGFHKKSLWRDASLIPRDLGGNGETIFDIIMPWVKEQKDELEKKKLSLKAKPKKTKIKQESDLGLQFDEKDQLRYTSKVIRLSNVETFNWKFKDEMLIGKSDKTIER